MLLPEIVKTVFLLTSNLHSGVLERKNAVFSDSVFKHLLVAIASYEEHVVDHGPEIYAEEGLIDVDELALVLLVRYWQHHPHLADGVNVLFGLGLQDELLQAAQERSDFVKHSPVQRSVWRHRPNTLDEVVASIPPIELDGTIRLSESRIETAQMGDGPVKALNPLGIEGLGAGCQGEFRVVCPADGHQAVLRTETVSIPTDTYRY